MKRLISLAASALLLASCVFNFGGTVVTGYTEEGCDASQERPMMAFSTINASGPFNVYYVQSNESKVLVEGKEEFLDKVLTEVKKDELFIELEKGKYHNLVLKVTVFSPVADDINISGSGNFIDNAGHSSARDIEFRTAGSGDIYLNSVSSKQDIDVATAGSGDVYVERINCEDLDVASAGSGNVSLNGIDVKDFDVKIAGSGDATIAQAVVHGDTDLTIKGSGSINAEADFGNEVEVSIAGSGNIALNGKCNIIEVNIQGSGDVSGDLSYNRISTNCKGSGRVRL